MSDFTIPPKTAYSFKKGDHGAPVYAIQRGLNTTRYGGMIAMDGMFGAQTKRAVEVFQSAKDLTPDGVFGPKSSAALARDIEDQITIALPAGLVHGIVQGESGSLVGAVNWSVSGGVDCSYFQRRVYSGSYGDEDVIKRAFSPAYQADLLARSLLDRHEAFFGTTGAQTNEMAWRLATLNHNYPSAASKISQVGISGLSDYWTSVQIWVVNIGAKFEDGATVRTPLDWCEHYSLGSAEHNDPGQMTRFVSSWDT